MDFRHGTLKWSAVVVLGVVFLTGTCWGTDFWGNVLKYHQPAHQELNLGLDAAGNTGALTYTYDIFVPDAPAGMKPTLNLQYSSHGENGPLGVGWALNIPYIQRRPGHGGLDYNATDFVLFEGLSRHDLTLVEPTPDFPTWQEFRFKHEDGRGLRFFLLDGGYYVGLTWRVLSKDQEWSYYGETATEQLRGPDRDGEHRIFTWHISRETDRYGNEIAYTYTPRNPDDTFGLSISLIDYALGHCQVSFVYLEDRQEAQPDYRSGFELNYRRKLMTIRSTAGPRRSSKYDFTYAHSKSSRRLLLSSITQVGRDDGALPRLDFEYTEQVYDNALDPSQLAFVSLQDTFAAHNYDPFGGVGPFETQWHLGDFNGDGRMDILHIRSLYAVTVWLGREDGTFDIKPDWTGGGPLSGSQLSQYRYRFQVGDFNGDGLADVLHTTGNNSANVWLSRLSSEGEFDYFEVHAFSGPSLQCVDPAARGPFFLPNDERNAWDTGCPLQFVNHIADFNADGKDDILGFYPQPQSSELCAADYKSIKGRYFIYFSIGDGTFALKEWRVQVNASWPYDFSLPTRGDIITLGSCDAEQWVSGAAPRQYGVAVADVNGDGLPDLVHPKGTQIQTYCSTPLVVFLNQGVAEDAQSAYDISFVRLPCQLSAPVIFGSLTQYDPVVFQYGDNGDGLLDILNSDEQSGPDVLTSMTNLNDWTPGYNQFLVSDMTSFEEQRRDGIVTGDFNGDRISDYGVMSYGRSDPFETPPEVFLYLGVGDGTVRDPLGYDHLSEWFEHVATGPYCLVADFTGDGKSDFLNLYWDSAGGGRLEWTGMYKSAGELPDLLSVIKRGGTTVAEMEYGPVVAGSHAGVPMVVAALQGITYHDGLNTSFGIDYASSGGHFDAYDNEFAGFGRVVESYPDGTYAEVRYNNEDGDRDRRGTAYDRRLYSPTGTLLMSELTDWQVLGSQYPKFACPATRSSTTYDGSDSVTTNESFTYDPIHYGVREHVVAGTDAENITTSRTYVNLDTYMWKLSNETIIGATSGPGRNTHYTYYTTDLSQGKKGSLYSVVEAFGAPEERTTTYTYTPEGNVYEVLRQDAGSTRYTYEERFTYPETVTMFSGVQTYWEEEFFYTDRFGVPVMHWDKNNNLTYYGYDEFGRRNLSVTYDGPDQLTEAIVAESHIIRDDFSVPNFTLTERLAGVNGAAQNYVTEREYSDLLGRRVQTNMVGDESGGQPRYIVERNVTDVVQNTEFKYGPFFSASDDFVPTTSIPTGIAREEKHYDWNGRLSSERHVTEEHGLASKQYAYTGRNMTVTDEDGRLTRIQRDHLGRTTAVAEIKEGGQEAVTQYSVDAEGSITSITGVLAETYDREYDLLGRLKTLNHPDVGQLSYNYDASGGILSMTEADGLHIWTDRDFLGRAYAERFQRGGGGNAFTYEQLHVPNSGDKLTVAENLQSRWASRAFDAMGNCVGDTVSILGAPVTAIMSYAYDEASRPASITYPAGSGAYHADYTYYPQSSLVKQVLAATAVSQVSISFSEYSAHGRPGRVEYFRDSEPTPFITVLYALSAVDDRIYGIVARNRSSDGQPKNDLLNLSYSYSAAGDLLTQVDFRKGDILNKPNNEYVYTYQYDERHRLRKVFETGVLGVALEMKYDDAGRITEKWFRSRKVTYSYQGSPLHGVKSVVVGQSTYPISYDTRGNVISNVSLEGVATTLHRSFEYGAENRMSRVLYWLPGVPDSSEARVYYGPDRGRVRKDAFGGPSTFYFNPYYQVENYTSPSNYAHVEYVYVGSQRLLQRGSGGTRVLLSDMLGSVQVTCDDNGAPVYALTYDAWGKPQDVSGAEFTRWQYTGQEREQEYKLFNFNAREYDAAMGVFVAPDGVDQNVGDPQLLNRYCYARNNPLKFTDPSGSLADAIVDAAFISMDVTAFVSDLRSKRYGYAAVDAGGIVLDVALTGVPIAPAIAGALMRSGRAANSATDLLKVAESSGFFGRAVGKARGVLRRVLGQSAERAGVGVAHVEGASTLERVGKSEVRVIDRRRLDHIFGQPRHKLGDLVARLGSEEAAYRAVEAAAEEAVRSQKLSGVTEFVVRVADIDIVVRGNAMESGFRMGTFFRP